MLFNNGKTLSFEIMHGLHLLYTVELISLYDSERNLDAGRFEHFSIQPQQYSIKIKQMDMTGREGFRWHVAQHVGWIAEQCRGTWSMALDRRHVSDHDMIYTFDNVTDAVLFKLVWF
jgi:hypothetical protein